MHPIGNTFRSEKDSDELSYDENVFSIFLSFEKIYAKVIISAGFILLNSSESACPASPNISNHVIL
jgi:hypothetical protein